MRKMQTFDLTGALNEVAAHVRQRVRDQGLSDNADLAAIYLAGSVAIDFHTRMLGDGHFSARVLMSHEDMLVTYRRASGMPWHLFLEDASRPATALVHEDFTGSSSPWLTGAEASRVLAAGLKVAPQVLSPTDLAVVRTVRFCERDLEDVRLLARRGHLNVETYRRRAYSALNAFFGDVDRVRSNIDAMGRIIWTASETRPKPRFVDPPSDGA